VELTDTITFLKKAHNTLEYDGKDQTEQWTTFRWKKPAKAFNKSIREDKNKIIFSAKHSGYKKYGIIHERTVEFNKELNELKVIDKLIGDNSKKAKIFWHFSPIIKLSRNAGSNKADGLNLFVIETEKTPLGTILIKGSKSEIKKTPYSRYYSKTEENDTLISKKNTDTDTIITTFIFNR